MIVVRVTPNFQVTVGVSRELVEESYSDVGSGALGTLFLVAGSGEGDLRGERTRKGEWKNGDRREVGMGVGRACTAGGLRRFALPRQSLF